MSSVLTHIPRLKNSAAPWVLLASLALVAPALSQTPITNTARIATPAGVVDSNPSNNESTVSTPIVSLLTVKSVNVGAGTPVQIGETLTYTLTSTIVGAPLSSALTLTDTLTSGLTFASITSAGAFSCNGAPPLICTLPAGTPAGVYSVVYTATVNAGATVSVGNTVVPSQGGCANCTPVNPVSSVSTTKSASVGAGASVTVGQSITYTLTSTVTGSALGSALTLTDTLTSGLTLGAVTSPGSFTCNAANPLICTLPSGTAPGAYSISYTATVNASATVSVGNSVVPNQGGCSNCTPVNPVASVNTTKSSNVGSGTAVQVGETITYTLTSTVSNGALPTALTLTDTLTPGLTFGAVTATGSFSCNAANPLVCTLPAASPPGSYSVSYTATVNASATTSVGNTVVPSQGACTTCSPVNPVASVNTTKSASVGAGTAVAVGQIITYTLTSTVSGGPLVNKLVLTDTLTSGLTFGAVTSAGSFSCNAANPFICTLPAATVPGTYSISYSATVNASATTSVGNTVVPDQGGCTNCSPVNPVVGVNTTKSSSVGSGTAVRVGETLTYTLTSTISGGALTANLVLTDTLTSGLTFGAVTSAGSFTCNAANPLICTLPAGSAAGSYSVSYTATVNATVTTSVGNTVVPNQGGCSNCSPVNPISNVNTTKSASVGPGVVVAVGQTITYTLTSTVTGAALTGNLVLNDTLTSGLTFGAVTSAGAFTCNAANPLICTLPAGTPSGTYALSYTATVNATATTSVGNTVVPNQGGCTNCTPVNPVLTVSTVKSVNVGVGTAVQAGETLTYTLSSTVSGGALASNLVLTDTLSAGLAFGSVTGAGAFTCNSASPLVCTLPSGTPAGTYDLAYTATVTAAASLSVGNTVVPNQGSCTTCSPVNPVTAVSTAKTSSVPAGTAVGVGQTITYTLSSTVSGAALGRILVLTDTLSGGLSFDAVTSAGAFKCNAVNPLVCALPAGTAAGVYPVSYTATVNSSATISVNNSVVASQGPCTNCSIVNPLSKSTVTYAKTATLPAGETSVKVGDTIKYTLSVTVASSPTTGTVTLTDTLSTGLNFLAITSSGAFSCNAANPVVCALPAATAVGTYSLSYTATVTAQASGTVNNAVLGSGQDNPTCAASCGTQTPVAAPVIVVSKSSDPASGTSVQKGQTLRFTLSASVANIPTRSPLVLSDTPDSGLTVGPLPAGCAKSGTQIVCTLPTGTAVGVYTFVYTAIVNAQAGKAVNNVVTATGGGNQPPTCTSCATNNGVSQASLLIVKTVGTAQVSIGDLVRYTLQVTNTGNTDLVNGSVQDVPPRGFTYVANSLQVSSGAHLTVSGFGPIHINGINLAAGNSITFSYLMRVGAGVAAGALINQAQVFSPTGTPISNIASAQVILTGNPLTDESLIFGSVYDDRNGDGWQASAALSHLSAHGGFAPGAYISNSTSLDRGEGARPLPDASAPLLHGITIGSLTGRQSDADSEEKHQVIIRQHLRELAFTDDFVLESAEGFTVRVNAQGKATLTKTGEAAKNLSAALPAVERHVTQTADGFEVAYFVRNRGVDERGIPGVRIVSVEGLVMETDEFGRFHLVGIPGGLWQRGRNFILKVDPATLPAGTQFTTANPLVRRITPGVPVRFDFGVKLPVRLIAGEAGLVQLELGSVLFAPGSALVRPQFQPVIQKMADRVRQYGGGEVLIEANGEAQNLAFERANAVKNALLALLEVQTAKRLIVSVRGHVDKPDSLILSVKEGGAVLGTVLFDTDKWTIRPEFAPLLDAVAADIERTGAGVVAVIGHTDVRGSHEYNTELGMRRATAVYQALAIRLSPEVRAKLRVQSNDNPAAPVGEPF